jgi:hypothetical protein
MTATVGSGSLREFRDMSDAKILDEVATADRQSNPFSRV